MTLILIKTRNPERKQKNYKLKTETLSNDLDLLVNLATCTRGTAHVTKRLLILTPLIRILINER